MGFFLSSELSFPLRPGTTWDQQLLLQEPQNMDNSKAVQGVLMGLLSPHLIMGQHNQPIVLASSSEPHQHFLQCSTYLSHSHNPMQCMATFSPLRQGSSSPAVPSLCRNRWSMPTSRPASRTHLLCGPCTPKLCIQPLDSWLPPSFPYRYKQQGSQALPPPANLAPDSLSSNTARTQDSITSNHQRAPAHPPSLRLGSYVPQTNKMYKMYPPSCLSAVYLLPIQLPKPQRLL